MSSRRSTATIIVIVGQIRLCITGKDCYTPAVAKKGKLTISTKGLYAATVRLLAVGAVLAIIGKVLLERSGCETGCSTSLLLMEIIGEGLFYLGLITLFAAVIRHALRRSEKTIIFPMWSLYIWSLVLIATSLGTLLLLRYWRATTFCTYSDCDRIDFVHSMVSPLALMALLCGAGLLIGTTIYFIVSWVKGKRTKP